MKKLEVQEFAFTTDDQTPEQKQNAILKKHKQRKLNVSDSTKEALNVPSLMSDGESNMNSNGAKRKVFKNKGKVQKSRKRENDTTSSELR